MRIISKLEDNRIQSCNILAEITLDEYYTFSQNIINNNEYQRNRVKSASTIYSLLKEDIKKGCIIPPIVLALEQNINTSAPDNEIERIILENRNKLIILDGLQRTYTIQELLSELEQDPEQYNQVKDMKIRLEIYVGVDKIGILYRMLTLNTGQTPMSMRHQIEIIYSDYINSDTLNGIKLVREVDDESPKELGVYKFKDIVEGFNSYIDKSYLTMDRAGILENIKSLEKLSKENAEKDLFRDFTSVYNTFALKMNKLASNWHFIDDSGEMKFQPFGKNALSIFNKSQVITGFGAAVGKLIEQGSIDDLDSCLNLIEKISNEKIDEALDTLIRNLDKIKSQAKKIGNDQRFYFYWIFRYLFDSENDGYLGLNQAVENAKTRYDRDYD